MPDPFVPKTHKARAHSVSAMANFDLALEPPHQTYTANARAIATTQTSSPQALYHHDWQKRDWFIAALLIVLALFCAEATWLWQGAVVPWDSKNHFYPMFRHLAQSLAQGEIPLWNPYHFGGHPSVADPQSLLFTPTFFLLSLVMPDASMQSFDVFVFAHLGLGALGVVGLFARRKLSLEGALLAALIYMFGGSASARLQHTGMIISYSFIPLALLFLETTLFAKNWRLKYLNATACALFTILMALGRDQIAYFGCLLMASALIGHEMASGNKAKFILHNLLALLLIGVLVLIAVGIPSLMTMQFISQSNRPGFSYGMAVTGSLAPINLVTLGAANFFGSLSPLYDYWGPSDSTISSGDWTDRAVDYLFIGTLPCLLIFAQGFVRQSVLDKRARFVGLVTIIALIYALGRYTPLFSLIFDHLPGVKLYRRPADATFILNFGLAMLAGFCLHGLRANMRAKTQAQSRTSLAFILAGLSALAIISCLLLALVFSIKEQHGLASLISLGETLCVFIPGAVLIMLARTPRWNHFAVLGLLALSAVDLLWHNSANALNAEPISNYTIYATPQPKETEALAVLRKDLAEHTQGADRPRVEILSLGGAWQNAAMTLGLEDTIGYNPLRISAYEDAVGSGENAGDFNLRHFPETFRGYTCRLAKLLGLGYLVIDRPIAKLPRHVPRPHATLLYQNDHLYVYRLPHPAARAYFADSAKAIDSEDVIANHTLPEFDRSHEMLVEQGDTHVIQNTTLIEKDEGDDAEKTLLTGANKTLPDNITNADVSIASYEANRVILSVDSDRPGFVVLHDLYYPGWEALVDDVPTPILRSNLLFRAVEVGTGHHVVRFVFNPLSLANLSAALGGIVGNPARDE